MKESPEDKEFMKKALNLARRGGGYVNPNPQVGAVVIREGEVVGKGYHEKFGAPHAEVRALEDAGAQAKGGVMYVTLEPCVHYGKTPPCTEAIMESGLNRLHVAIEDPNPKVSGKGIEKLRKAGVDVSLGLLKEEAEKLNEIYLHYVRTGRPFVLLKLAMTMDGKIATRSGDSRWISSEPARKLVHELRARYSGVGVGVNTVLSDDPRLNVRKASGPDGARFVFDPEGRTPPDSRILELSSPAPTIVVTRSDLSECSLSPLEGSDVEVWRVAGQEEKIDIEAFLEKMGDRGYDSLLVEGGGQLAWGFLSEGLVDKVQFFYSPRIVGGEKAVPAVGGSGVEKVDQGIEIGDTTVTRIGDDVTIEGYPGRR